MCESPAQDYDRIGVKGVKYMCESSENEFFYIILQDNEMLNKSCNIISNRQMY